MLTLIRHGESEQNQVLHQSTDPDSIVFKKANPRLTAIGIQQAQATGKHLKTDEPLEIWVSELDRAQQTLEEIKRHVPNAKITIKASLNEKSEAIVGQRKSEPLDHFIKRVEAFLPELDQIENLVIVGHSVFISVLTSLLQGHQITDLVYRNPNCAITIFKGCQLITQGNIDHIPKAIQTGVD